MSRLLSHALSFIGTYGRTPSDALTSLRCDKNTAVISDVFGKFFREVLGNLTKSFGLSWIENGIKGTKSSLKILRTKGSQYYNFFLNFRNKINRGGKNDFFFFYIVGKGSRKCVTDVVTIVIRYVTSCVPDDFGR